MGPTRIAPEGAPDVDMPPPPVPDVYEDDRDRFWDRLMRRARAAYRRISVASSCRKALDRHRARIIDQRESKAASRRDGKLNKFIG